MCAQLHVYVCVHASIFTHVHMRVLCSSCDGKSVSVYLFVYVRSGPESVFVGGVPSRGPHAGCGRGGSPTEFHGSGCSLHPGGTQRTLLNVPGSRARVRRSPSHALPHLEGLGVRSLPPSSGLVSSPRCRRSSTQPCLRLRSKHQDMP